MAEPTARSPARLAFRIRHGSSSQAQYRQWRALARTSSISRRETAADREQATNYDRLTLDIETDGSITPKEALASAGQTLRSLVGLLAELSSVPWGLELGDTAAGTTTSLDLDLPIEELDLSERPRNCLKRAQIDTIGQLVERTEDDLLVITNFGQKSLEEVVQKLDERGLSLRVKE